MNLITVPLRAYFPHLARTHQQHDEPDIELGLITTNNPAPTGSTTPFLISSLPTELRDKIYRLVLVSPNGVIWRGQYKTKNKHPHPQHQKNICNNPQSPNHTKPDRTIASLLLTCKAIQADASHVFYRNNHFLIACRTKPHRAHRMHPLIRTAHTLVSGLPLAFENPFFTANARAITLVCANRSRDFARDSYHACRLCSLMAASANANANNNGNANANGNNIGNDRISAITRSCTALQTLVVPETETADGGPNSLNWHYFVLLLTVLFLAGGGVVVFVGARQIEAASPPTGS
ncbi:hypothetical protein IMSHALPRED_009660 [Imshaugia aleurites]|uniref:DUF7730 domain-containing protein n=1 Tax=Imshaugia aleurites TaxID=172621 RepID=A0A8H3IUM1_9LECA|nr:hypothetical protein IMSHALPRED_009660 [Imshaugia aleurites]